ncbi:hypothetical protein HOLleu_42544 [Holothuria leucospilota]|uniref:Retropepsins domain-containing protein n=1 Tax=Holothuria leucospilota TaxID=206669 RepID=A0A9Q0YCR5_HOLLE|nr:hypothetical protein HOLleu_42544 [Holothuria leucospilota]
MGFQSKPLRDREEVSTSDESSDIDNPTSDGQSFLTAYTIKVALETGEVNKPLMAKVKVNGKSLNMEIDTGSGKSIISYQECRQKFPKVKLRPVSVVLKTVTGQKIDLCGTISVKVEYNHQKCVLPLMVIKGNSPSLMGRDWLSALKVDWKTVFTVNRVTKLTDSVAGYNVFNDDMGCVKGVKVKLELAEGAQPKFFKPRALPFAQKSKVGDELERMVKSGILEKVDYSNWASPIVPVRKTDGTVRICGD